MKDVRAFEFDSDGSTLFATETGAGDPVVMLHGTLADHRAVRPHLPALPDDVRLVTPDVRGNGRSIDAGPLSWSQLARDVVALLDHLELPQAVVGGLSAGTGVAVRCALQHPGRVAGIVLVHPVFPGESVGYEPAQHQAFHRMDDAARAAVDNGIEALLPLYQGLPDGVRERASAMVMGFDPASCAASTTLLVDGPQPLAHPRDLEDITAPALLVPGSDPIHPASVASTYAGHLSNATTATDAGLGEAMSALCRRAFAAP